MNVTCHYLLESNPQVGIFSLDLLISASHLVLNDINIEIPAKAQILSLKIIIYMSI